MLGVLATTSWCRKSARKPGNVYPSPTEESYRTVRVKGYQIESVATQAHFEAISIGS